MSGHGNPYGDYPPPPQTLSQDQGSQPPGQQPLTVQPHNDPATPQSVQMSLHQQSPLEQSYYLSPFAPSGFAHPALGQDAQFRVSPNAPSPGNPQWPELGSESASEAKQATKARRRSQAGGEKHKRTKSGCYTCRNRRIKCDENKPVCERCRKGSRECIFPDAASGNKPPAAGKRSKQRKDSPDSSSPEDSEDDGKTEKSSLSVSVQGMDDASSKAGSSSRRTLGDFSKSPSATAESLVSPLTTANEGMFPGVVNSGSVRGDSLFAPPSYVSENQRWQHLSPDEQFLLDFYLNNIESGHYFFKHDPEDFCRTMLLEHALEFQPLLYALIGFAAFLYTLRQPDTEALPFLQHYNRAVSLLRQFLRSGERNTPSAIFTVLQLATFEEYLSDWVNLMKHQRAANEMIKELYSPNSLVETEVGRKILLWYSRFDLFSSTMAGNESLLGVEWYTASKRYHQQRLSEEPDNIDIKIEYLIASHRVLGIETAQLFAQIPKGRISAEEFTAENQKLEQRIQNFAQLLTPILANTDHKTFFPGDPSPSPDPETDPSQPAYVFTGPLFSINYVILDWTAIDAMRRYQTQLIFRQQRPEELLPLALQMSRLIEGLERFSEDNSPAPLPAAGSLAVTCILLPNTERYINWCRRKLLQYEIKGYTFPQIFRAKMAEHWEDPSVHHWWLKNEEMLPPIRRAIRSFINERTEEPKTPAEVDLRMMKALFQNLDIG